MGGPSGEVGFPIYLANAHSQLMYGLADSTAPADPGFSQTMKSIGEAVITGTNPYTSIDSYNADSDLSNFENSIVGFEGVAGSLDAESIWIGFANTAISMLDQIDPNSAVEDTQSDIDADVDAFDVAADTQLARSYNRVASSLQDINAVVSTVFPASLAIMESGHASDVARFRTDRTLEANRNNRSEQVARSATVIQGIAEMIQLESTRVSSQQATVGMRESLNKFTVAARVDETRNNVALNLDETTFDLNAMNAMLSSISAISGIPAVPKGMTSLEQLLSGATTVASLAVSVGAAGGLPFGILTAIGGAFGLDRLARQ